MNAATPQFRPTIPEARQQAAAPSTLPAEMQRIEQKRYSGAEHLESAYAQTPEPGPGDLLVEMQAAPLTRGDWHLVRGRPLLVRAVFGLRRPRQPVPGMYVAGQVRARGAEVSDLAVGDPVLAYAPACFADYVKVPAKQAVRVPAHVDLGQAAALPHGGFAALQALRDAARLEAGERVLILGAAGAVGSLAVQLACASGAADVTGVCHGDDESFVRGLGAERCLDFTSEDFAADARARGQRYDVIVDAYGGHAFGRLRSALTERGRAVMVAVGHGSWTGSMHRALGAALSNPLRRQKILPFLARPTRADLAELLDALARGSLRAHVEERYALPRIAAAFTRLEEGRVRGSLVIRGSSDAGPGPA